MGSSLTQDRRKAAHGARGPGWSRWPDRQRDVALHPVLRPWL